MTKPFLFLLAFTFGGVATARAQHHTPAGTTLMPGMTHSMTGMAGLKMDHTAAPGTPVAAFQHGMDSVMVVMDEGMRRMDGARPDDIDASFAAMMLPHHQGAVDMARLQLLYGKDPALRRLAQSIIAEQQVEIQQMAAWLKQHPVGTQNPGK
ncbi:DUF305 domain-containing protein [Hymenobacter defluvii]|jgi:uncharacterized protein (DUF305 family)|uniref:DUF305 domain-containing protein n=1 Tax=Hymenobacter defluvii TaxID=2054411 RepID=A0ABS3T953_9BACT|nr:DUF305 domain-containing protein [Hymenobacter defluvii]MBO3269159.1 DUF305 domain-containing protein [Hymenobacter defluvii]